MRIVSRLILAALATSCLPALAADPPAPAKKLPAVTDPAKADADFAIQGEYVASGPEKVGAQVIARSAGKFHLVVYPGGLPGDGWKSGQDRIESDGETNDGVTTFRIKKDAEHNPTAAIKDGVLTLGDATSKVELKHVIRKSPTEGAEPPQGAIMLFDGKNADEWKGGKGMDGAWLTEGSTTKRTFQSYQLHVEFMLPYEPDRSGQDRGNSGVYQQGRYEVQVLDSFGLAAKSTDCGGIYEIKEPAVNMCYPPLSWQTYDIDFTAATFDAAGKKTVNAKISVKHNGVVIQEDTEIPRTTRSAVVGKEGPEPGPIYLQDHGHPVRFKNIWLVEKK